MPAGLLVGSFDPVCVFDVLDAEALLSAGADKVYLIPVRNESYVPDMLKALCERVPGCEICQDKEKIRKLMAESDQTLTVAEGQVCPIDDIPQLDSAKEDIRSGVREQITAYRESDLLLPETAVYIAQNGLYHTERFEEKMASVMNEKRFRHTLGVRDMAVKLANIHQIPLQKAALAALLHDCAKDYPKDKQRELAVLSGITDERILSSGEILHSFAGAYEAQHRWEIRDADILNAIRYHTVGRRDMTMLELCVFVADACEMNRAPYPGLDEIRAAAQTDLRAAALISLKRTKEYVLSRGLAFNPVTDDTIAWLESIG